MIFDFNNTPQGMTKYIEVIRSIFNERFSYMPKGVHISVNFVSKGTLRDLNYEFKQIGYSTDVLTFPLAFPDDETLKEGDLLGEVYVSEVVAKRNATDHKVPVETELVRVVVHGLLHLLGYNHKGTLSDPDEEDREMFELQEKIVNEVVK